MQNRPLVLDLVEWLAERPQPYEAVMAAWRTSCPQLTVWEDAVDAGLVAVAAGEDSQKQVHATEAGLAFLRQHGRGNASANVEPN